MKVLLSSRVRAAAVAAAAALVAVAVPSGASAPTALPATEAAAVSGKDACGNPQAPGSTYLFDGTAASQAGWKQSGPGTFTRNAADCSLVSEGGLGLYWYAAKGFRSYKLQLDWRIQKLGDNSGVFIGFPGTEGSNTHNAAISNGYEVQIDQLGRSDGAPKHITGAIYAIQGPNTDTRTNVTKPLDWNTYVITVDDPKITVELNGVVVNEYIHSSPRRNLKVPTFIGLQAHGTGDVAAFRNIQVTEIEPGQGGGGTGPVPLALTSMRNNVGIDQGPTSGSNFDGGGFSYSAAALAVAGVRGGTRVTADGITYTWPSTQAGQPDNVVVNGQALKLALPEGATRLGVLGSSTHGPSTATWTFVYRDAEGETVRVPVVRTLSDWTLNGGGSAPSAGNTVAITTIMRSTGGGTGQPERVPTNVFSMTLPIDPTMALQYVELPKGYAGTIHLFDAVAAR